MKSSLTVLTLAAALGTVASPAAAVEPGHYSGKTDGGYDIAFAVKHGKVKNIRGYVPTTCVSPTGVLPRAGGELFEPRGAFRIGKVHKQTRKQQPAMHYAEVTKYYTITLKKTKRGFKAKLHVNFSYQDIDYAYSSPRLRTWICRGDDSFTAV